MGNLYVVATPIGNLSDFSPRAIEVLKGCDLILVEDTRQTIKLLNHFEIKNKMMSYHKFNEAQRTGEIIDVIRGGKNVALVSDAGTPCISDPGYILVKGAKESGINVIGIPGCSAVITALSVSGVDTSSFTFYGFVPIENKSRKELFDEIRESKVRTKVLYESPKRIMKLLEDINNEFPNSLLSVCSEMTKVHEKYFYGSSENVLQQMKQSENVQKGEYVVIIQNEPGLEKEVSNIAIEAKIVDSMIKNNCSLKDAIEEVNKKEKNLTKKEIYSAGLRLKELLKK